MTREQAKKIYPVIQAFAEGKAIQWKDINGNWKDGNTHLSFENGASMYRIKPESKWAPFTIDNAKELLGKGVKRKDSNAYFTIVVASESRVVIGNKVSNYNHLLEEYTFIDGSPCGILIDE